MTSHNEYDAPWRRASTRIGQSLYPDSAACTTGNPTTTGPISRWGSCCGFAAGRIMEFELTVDKGLKGWDLKPVAFN